MLIWVEGGRAERLLILTVDTAEFAISVNCPVFLGASCCITLTIWW